jgi:hypothetical protein
MMAMRGSVSKRSTSGSRFPGRRRARRAAITERAGEHASRQRSLQNRQRQPMPRAQAEHAGDGLVRDGAGDLGELHQDGRRREHPQLHAQTATQGLAEHGRDALVDGVERGHLPADDPILTGQIVLHDRAIAGVAAAARLRPDATLLDRLHQGF